MLCLYYEGCEWKWKPETSKIWVEVCSTLSATGTSMYCVYLYCEASSYNQSCDNVLKLFCSFVPLLIIENSWFHWVPCYNAVCYLRTLPKLCNIEWDMAGRFWMINWARCRRKYLWTILAFARRDRVHEISIIIAGKDSKHVSLEHITYVTFWGSLSYQCCQVTLCTSLIWW
jgi:hypothetical protein